MEFFSSINGSMISTKGQGKNLRFILGGKHFFYNFLVLDLGIGILVSFDFFEKFVPILFSKNTFQPTPIEETLEYPYALVSKDSQISFLIKAIKNILSMLSLAKRRISIQEQIKKKKHKINQF